MSEHTIAVNSAMGARLLAITLDLLSSAFIARACYTSSLLEWLRPDRLIIADVIARGVLVTEPGAVFLLRSFVLTRMGRVCLGTLGCGMGGRSHSDRGGTMAVAGGRCT